MSVSRALTGGRKHIIPTARVALRGESILTNPRFNKGTCFTDRERKDFGLIGRLPSRVNTLDEQVDRAYEQLSTRHDPLRKNTFLQSLKDQNWVLYYALVSKYLKELVPIIYTPTQVRCSGVPPFHFIHTPHSPHYWSSSSQIATRQMQLHNILICLGEARVCI